MGSLIGMNEKGKPYRKEYKEAPFILERGKRKYEFVKEYENFYLYKDSETGCKVSFNKAEFAKEIIKPEYGARWARIER